MKQLEKIMDNFKNPQNYGKPEKFDKQFLVANPTCGDKFEVYVSFENDKITDFKFEGSGCSISTAMMSLFSEEIIGKTIKEIKQITEEDIIKIFGTRYPPTRKNCVLMPKNFIEKLSKPF